MTSQHKDKRISLHKHKKMLFVFFKTQQGMSIKRQERHPAVTQKGKVIDHVSLSLHLRVKWNIALQSEMTGQPDICLVFWARGLLWRNATWYPRPVDTAGGVPEELERSWVSLTVRRRVVGSRSLFHGRIASRISFQVWVLASKGLFVGDALKRLLSSCLSFRHNEMSEAKAITTLNNSTE